MSIVLNIFDSLRRDHVGAYGYERDTTPHIDQLATDNVIYENGTSQAIWTAPSAPSILSGFYPESHQAWVQPDQVPQVPSIFQLVPSDWSTCLISSTGLVSETRFPDVDEFMDLSDSKIQHSKHLASEQFARAKEYIQDVDGDFLLVNWTNSTHTPYRSTDYKFIDNVNEGNFDPTSTQLRDANRENVETVKDAYDDAIRCADEAFGDFIRFLKEGDIYDDLCVVVTADHGEIFNEHYRFEKLPDPWSRIISLLPARFKTEFSMHSDTGWVGHQAILPYDELINVPLIVKYPGNEYRGRVSSLVETLDIVPTICDVIGKSDKFKGSGEVLPTEDGTPHKETTISTSNIALSGIKFHSIQTERWKYIRLDPWDSGVATAKRKYAYKLIEKVHPTEVLLDRTTGEMADESGSNGEKLEEFREIYRQYKSQSVDKGVTVDELSPDTVDTLEDLGYI